MITLDLKKELKTLYAPSAKAVQEVVVPRFKFVRLDGEIEPGHGPSNSPRFEEDLQAMYGAAYTLKFASKLRKQDPVDYPVMALEGLWWTESGAYDITKPEGWMYTLMILQPEHITAEMFGEAQASLRKKKPNPAIERLRLEEFEEGRCVQVMHLGPYSEEMRTIQMIDEYMTRCGLRARGKHHEIYLGDPRKAKPENMKTILRHPVEA
jgi:hypothetical protein